jgi:hypothetical protein
VIQAYQHRDGTIYVTATEACKKGETLLSWPNTEALQAEATARAAADTALQSSIDAEAGARAAKDTDLQAQVTSLQTRLDAQQAQLDARYRKTVFVSSSTWGGNLGGLTGADGKCQALASAAGLPGTYKAWLSSSTTNAKDRLTHSALPYVLVIGVKVADDWADLTDGSLDAPINVDERGQLVSGGYAWTGTSASGDRSAGDPDHLCLDWAAGSTSFDGLWGRLGYDTQWWTRYDAEFCNQLAHLYCFEQ